MNAKELKIVPPEGYEIDRENSSIDTIRFKPIKKKIKYHNIAEKLFLNKITYFISVNGEIGSHMLTENPSRANNATSKQQIEQLLALNKLMNVAKYLNGNWEPDWNDRHQHKWFIFYDHQLSGLYLAIHYTQRFASVYFKSEELAYQAIEILGEEEVKKALGIFE